jgi:hypothetical protein
MRIDVPLEDLKEIVKIEHLFHDDNHIVLDALIKIYLKFTWFSLQMHDSNLYVCFIPLKSTCKSIDLELNKMFVMTNIWICPVSTHGLIKSRNMWVKQCMYRIKPKVDGFGSKCISLVI